MKNTIITAYDPEHNGCVVYELNTSSKEEAILKSIEVLDMHGYVPECGTAEDFLYDYASDGSTSVISIIFKGEIVFINSDFVGHFEV